MPEETQQNKIRIEQKERLSDEKNETTNSFAKNSDPETQDKTIEKQLEKTETFHKSKEMSKKMAKKNIIKNDGQELQLQEEAKEMQTKAEKKLNESFSPSSKKKNLKRISTLDKRKFAETLKKECPSIISEIKKIEKHQKKKNLTQGQAKPEKQENSEDPPQIRRARKSKTFTTDNVLTDKQPVKSALKKSGTMKKLKSPVKKVSFFVDK